MSGILLGLMLRNPIEFKPPRDPDSNNRDVLSYDGVAAPKLESMELDGHSVVIAKDRVTGVVMSSTDEACSTLKQFIDFAVGIDSTKTLILRADLINSASLRTIVIQRFGKLEHCADHVS